MISAELEELNVARDHPEARREDAGAQSEVVEVPSEFLDRVSELRRSPGKITLIVERKSCLAREVSRTEDFTMSIVSPEEAFVSRGGEPSTRPLKDRPRTAV